MSILIFFKSLAWHQATYSSYFTSSFLNDNYNLPSLSSKFRELAVLLITVCHDFNSELGIIIIQSIVCHTLIKRRARYNILSATKCDKKQINLPQRNTRHRSNRPGFQLSHISLILARVILTEFQRRLKSRVLRQK